MEASAPRGLRILPLLAALGIELVVLGIVFVLALLGLPAPRMEALDGVAIPGETLTLEVRIERDVPPFLRGLLEGIEVRARCDWDSKAVLKTRTATGGIARFEVRAPEQAGTHWVDFEAAGQGDSSLTARALLLVAEREARPAIVGVRGTLWDPLLEALPSPKAEHGPPPRAGAAEVLRALASSHPIVYASLHFRYEPAVLPSRLHGWLERHGFPQGPILAAEADPEESAPWIVLRDLLREKILARWPRPAWAVGSSPDEVGAFAALGIRTFRLGPAPAAGDIAGVKNVPDWPGLKRALEETGR